MSNNYTLLRGGDLIIGDGSYLPSHDLLIKENKIKKIASYIPKNKEYNIIDCKNFIVIPGLINIHAHGIVYNSPLFSSGSKYLSKRKIKTNLKKHLSQGTTTLVNMDGFAYPNDIAETNSDTPIRILSGTTHFPSAYEAAEKLDGAGFDGRNFLDIGNVLGNRDKYIMIGENGSGATFGGGVQDYLFIPNAIRNETGKKINKDQARIIKEACLGKYMIHEYNKSELSKIIDDFNLRIDSEKLDNLIIETVMPSYKKALYGINEGARLAKKYKIPMLTHTATASMDVVKDVAAYLGGLLIAGHCNHSTFEKDEMLDLAKKLKGYDAKIEVSTFDLLSNNKKEQLENLFSMMNSGVVDFLSTDYGGGNHSSILDVLKIGVEKRYFNLEDGIRFCTNNPANMIEGLAPERGILKEGKIADLAILEKENISNVKKVFIDGKIVYNQ